jgi:hypothetical protein
MDERDELVDRYDDLITGYDNLIARYDRAIADNLVTAVALVAALVIGCIVMVVAMALE